MKRNLTLWKGGGRGGVEVVEVIPDSDCGKEGMEGVRLLKYHQYMYIHLSWERGFINHLSCMPRP